MFDPQQFLEMQVTDSNDTKVIQVAVGEYLAVIEKIEAREWQKKDDPSVNGKSLDVTWNIDDPEQKAIIGRDKLLVRQSVGLDFTDAGGLDMGKGRNAQLGRLREAVGQNRAGQAWGFSMLVGGMAKVKVSHRPDDRNPGDVFAEIKAVAKP